LGSGKITRAIMLNFKLDGIDFEFFVKNIEPFPKLG
jgi:hypothetical protein